MLFQEVWKEEELQDDEDDEELDEDDGPQRPSQLHVTEAVVVEIEDASCKVGCFHRP